MYAAIHESDFEKVKQEAYLEAIDNTLQEVRDGKMEFVSIDVNRDIKTIRDETGVIDMHHTGIITISFTIRPKRKL